MRIDVSPYNTFNVRCSYTLLGGGRFVSYFRRASDGWTLVGLERLPESLPTAVVSKTRRTDPVKGWKS